MLIPGIAQEMYAEKYFKSRSLAIYLPRKIPYIILRGDLETRGLQRREVLCKFQKYQSLAEVFTKKEKGSMANYLSVDNIAFTVIGYPMSYIEFVGTILYVWSVWLIAKRRMLTWPVGIVSVLSQTILFYQIRLYSTQLSKSIRLVKCLWLVGFGVNLLKDNGQTN